MLARGHVQSSDTLPTCAVTQWGAHPTSCPDATQSNHREWGLASARFDIVESPGTPKFSFKSSVLAVMISGCMRAVTLPCFRCHAVQVPCGEGDRLAGGI